MSDPELIPEMTRAARLRGVANDNNARARCVGSAVSSVTSGPKTALSNLARELQKRLELRGGVANSSSMIR